MSAPMKSSDPAYWMLERGYAELAGTAENTGWVTERTIHKDGCYICEDHEFALMGLPLCSPCPVMVDGVECGEHVPADDVECEIGHNVMGEYRFDDEGEAPF